MRRTAWVRALVTGASSGIGRAMAQELARGGTALVLVAPDGDRLAELAGSLPTDVEVLVADLTDPQQLHTVGQRCAATDRPVDLLVNNAGIWSFGPLTGPAGDAAERMVALNVGAVVALSRAAARRMVESGRGSILNISSVAASQPAPFEAVYAASKTFVAIFGQALHEELRGTGVHVTTVAPGMTRTELHATGGGAEQFSRVPDWVWMEPQTVAARALRAAARRRVVYVPALGYRAACVLAEAMPRFLNRKLAARVNRRRARVA